MHITTTLACPVAFSPHVEQVAQQFGMRLEAAARQSFAVEVPSLEEDWSLGAIVGPSGSGKSSIARAAFASAVLEATPWPRQAALVDGFGDARLEQITRTLTAVGFSSPPAWLRPYHALSQGERFRADLARALLTNSELVVCDEFTSTLDRTVAKTASAALAKAIRGGRIAKRFVAVTCHRDTLPWLQPDWILEMPGGRLTRGRLRRPPIELTVAPARQRDWEHFAQHHYLSGGLSRGARCYVARWHDEPVAFCAVIGMLGHRQHKRVTRLVVLPDYQGLGIGGRLLEWVARRVRESGERISITTNHPAMCDHLALNERWRRTQTRRLKQSSQQTFRDAPVRDSFGRTVTSFEFVG